MASRSVHIFYFIAAALLFYKTKPTISIISSDRNIVKPVVKAVASLLPLYVEPCFVEYPKNCSNPGIEIRILYEALKSIGKCLLIAILCGWKSSVILLRLLKEERIKFRY